MITLVQCLALAGLSVEALRLQGPTEAATWETARMPTVNLWRDIEEPLENSTEQLKSVQDSKAQMNLTGWDPSLVEKKVNGVIQCDDAGMENALWGVWIDGRDASKGKEVYGKTYGDTLLKALQKIHQMKDTAGTTLSYADWKKIEPAYEDERTFVNPVRKEVKKCHAEVFDASHVDGIFAGITVMDRDYKDNMKGASSYKQALSKLFEDYNVKIVAADNDFDQKVKALAFLMRNLAFLHPLRDRNGRSRMLLTQYELRRNNMACGAMLYNNNKDVYFQTEDEFAAKLKEGIQMYQIAEKTGSNPWEAQERGQEHELRFPNPEKDELKHCWHKFCNYDWNDHKNDDRKGSVACTGTAIALQQREGEDGIDFAYPI